MNVMLDIAEQPVANRSQIALLKAAVKHVDGPDRLRLVQLLQQAETKMAGERILLPAEPSVSRRSGAR